MSDHDCLFWHQQKRTRQRARKAVMMPRFNSRAPYRDALLLMPEKKHTGFTLIEVLIALMIIAIALSAAMRATTESIRATRNVRNITVAHFVAMNVISEIQINMLPLSESNNPVRGKTNMLGQDWIWSATLEPNNKFNLEQIKIKVRLKDQLITTLIGYDAQ